MPPVVSAALASWEWRPTILVGQALFLALYGVGWVRLRRRRRTGLATPSRLIRYLTGQALLTLALLSFIDIYGGLLLYMHMVQHLLLLMFIPVLLLWADPFPIMMWALPVPVRDWVAGHLQDGAPFRETVQRITPLGLLYGLYVGTIIVWHDPDLYNLAQDDGLIHDLEHISFFGAALLFWWPILGAGPHIRRRASLVGRMSVLILCIPPHVIIGGLLSFVEFPVYEHYLSVPRFWAMDVMQDQRLAGIIMWIPTSMMYVIGVVILLARHLAAEEKRKRQNAEVAPDPA